MSKEYQLPVSDGIGMVADGNYRISMTVDQYNEQLAKSAKVERELAVETDRDRIAAWVNTRFCYLRYEDKDCDHDACNELFDLLDVIWDRKKES